MCARAAERFGATIILKGHYTIVTAADGMQYINITGNCGMATGGSGDVLAGITAALIGRGAPEGAAAAAADYYNKAEAPFAEEIQEFATEMQQGASVLRSVEMNAETNDGTFTVQVEVNLN